MKWIAVMVTAVLVLALSYTAFLLGRLRRNDRWTQGYDAGKRVGWYDATDLLREDLDEVDDHRPWGAPGFMKGYHAAHMRLETYWDKLDEGDDHGPFAVERAEEK